MMRLFLGLLGEDVSTFRRYAMMALASGVLNALTIALTVPGLSHLLRGDTAAAWPWLVALVLCGLGCWLIRRVVERAGIQVGIAVLEGMRLRLGAHVARLPVGWFNARTTGKLTHALTQGVMEVAQLPAHVFTPVLSGLVVPPVLVLVLFVLAPDIGIVTLVALPIMGLAAALSARLGQRADAGYQSAAAETGQRAIEFARTQSVLRAFSGEGGSVRHLAAAFDEQRDVARHLTRLSTASSVLNGWMTQALFAAVLVVVLAQLNTGLTPDQTLSLILALILVQRFIEPLTELAGYGEALRAARGHLEALHEIAEAPPLPQAATPRSPEDATIRLEHVGFRYAPNSAPVLDGLTLTVPEGSMTALIGASGSGKSTVARLIARFYDVGEGRIEIGGVDLRDMSEETLAAQVSQIFQDTYLVSGTIGENIRMGRADAAEAELAEVIAQAGIDEILARLPEGLETEVGEGGVRLSGGERQRITIARALLKAAPILLVDEATAALDAENQAVIARTLHHLRGKCTMVVIAHQLSTVQMADQIAVLEGGKIVECGTPADLATRSGPYARFLAQRHEASGWRITPAGQIMGLVRSCALPLGSLLLCCVSLMVGANGIGLRRVLDPSSDALLTLTASRLPRLIALILTGGGLAICGVILQQILRNRFAEPATIGGMEAAKLGILVALTTIPTSGALVRMGFALVFCLIASAIFVALLSRIRFRDAVLVPVIGLMFAGVLSALAEFYAFSRNILQSMQGWMIGDFSRVVQGQYELIYLILPVVAVTYLFARRFTVLAMGQDMSESLGLRYRPMVALGLVLVSATVAATVITAGAVPFVGLVVPNVVALWRGDNLQKTLPLVAMSGAILLLLCDILGRVVIYPYEVPLGLTVGGLGGVIFLVLILRGTR